MKLVLPWPPRGLSPNSRLHWARLAQIKKQYRNDCAVTAQYQGARCSNASSLNLSITFYPPTKRDYDLDNALASMKSGLDGLADVFGVDDRHWSYSIAKGEGTGGYVEVEVTEK